MRPFNPARWRYEDFLARGRFKSLSLHGAISRAARGSAMNRIPVLPAHKDFAND
ncbi:MAG TPA: hypothetical protein VFS89_02275 [Nitrosospira sp.]|nr:hypothetical protein [Nitrosospira sp.]